MSRGGQAVARGPAVMDFLRARRILQFQAPNMLINARVRQHSASRGSRLIGAFIVDNWSKPHCDNAMGAAKGAQDYRFNTTAEARLGR